MKSILLIEDNENIRNNATEILELSKYSVITAENGIIGIEKAIQYKPDLILCDIMMPLLDGYGVLHAIHKNDSIKNTPFIFLTAKTERSDFRKGMELGADDYISKPFNGTELLNAVESRLKKIESLKQDLAPGLEGMDYLLKTSYGNDLLKSLTESCSTNVYKKKQMVYWEGNHPNRLYYVIRGKVKVFKSNEEGKELVTDLYSPGDFLGYVALLEGEAYKDNAQALEETELSVIPKEDFDELVYNNKEVSKKFIQLLAKNVSSKEDQLLSVAYNSLRKKVANALLTLQKKYQEDNNVEFVLNINRESLANVAGTAKESLIRTLGDFRNEKLIEIKKDGSILIINQKKLSQLLN